MSKPFEKFINQLSETNATLDYFTDFKKIKGNVNKIEIKLNQLNYLIGKKDLKKPKHFDRKSEVLTIKKNLNYSY